MSSNDDVTQNYELMHKKRRQLNDSWGLGEEEGWSLDQTAGTITFRFSDGKIVTASVQIIGTYDIPAQKFLWSWANPSFSDNLKIHALKFREKLRKRKVDMWLGEEFQMNETVAEWFTFMAANENKADGFYTGRIRDTILLVTFSGINISYDDDMVTENEERKAIFALPGTPVNKPGLLKFMQDYFAQMFANDKAFHEQSQQADSVEYQQLVDTLLSRQQEIYDENWHRTDQHHRPCSLFWPSEYDLSHTKGWRIFHLHDEIYRVTYVHTGPTTQTNAYYLENINGEWKILDFRYDIKDSPDNNS